MRTDHGIVYADPKLYCGWPANHGAWQWGDEFLVGFLSGTYGRKSMHNILEPYAKKMARSFDGGETWVIEQPTTAGYWVATDIDFDCLAPQPAPRLESCIIRVCGVYDHGGDYCDERGGYYASDVFDKGRAWGGPYLFTGLEEYFPGDGNILNTSRTCILDDLIFLSHGYAQIWGTDETFCARFDGERFHFVSTVCGDDARAVMPSAARLSNERIVVALRRRKSGRREGWVDVFKSDDEAQSWQHAALVGITGGHNGNPPALLALPDDRLLCCYGNRDYGDIILAISEDHGATWRNRVLRETESSESVDVGYPQLFRRDDGGVCCVYYWTSDERPQQHIARTIFYP